MEIFNLNCNIHTNTWTQV